MADRLILGGLETHIITYTNELLRRGHQLLLYTAHTEPDILAQINNQNHNFRYLFWTENPLQDLSDFAPEIIHAHPFTAIVKGYEIAQAMQIPLVITMHGLYDFGLDRSPLGYLIGERVHRIIAVDQAVASLLKSSTSFPEKIVVIPNGIDLSVFYPQPFNKNDRKKWGILPDWDTITVISRFDDGKERAIIQLLQCAKVLANAINGLHLFIVGDGSRFSQIKMLVDHVQENAQNLTIHLVGRQNDVRQFIDIADLCLACDRTAMEAMACGRVVFSMNGCGFAGAIDTVNFREILLNRSSYREYTDTELVARLVNLIKDKPYRRQLADRGLDIVCHNFDIVDSVNKLEKIFNQA
jgi:glycosyltransferase involved in cell wall biosynthesis